MLDLAIIGGGSAALSGAIYAARAGLEVKVFEKAEFGGVLPIISKLENYPGFLGEGKDLARQMRDQAKAVGATLEYGECSEIERNEKGFTLTIDGGAVEAKAVLVATGSEPKRLSFIPEAPVSYCALCDGALARDKHVAVIGGANSAAQEALYLAGLAEKVTIITHSRMKADQELLERLEGLTNVEIIEDLEPTRENLAPYQHIFVYIGKLPATKFLANFAEILDKNNFVIINGQGNFAYQTKIPGLFAAGDVRQGKIKQFVTAAADGASAAIEINNWLKTQ